MDRLQAEPIQHSCPSCGQPTKLTSYNPEPSLCLDCQRSYGLLKEEKALETNEPENPGWRLPEAIGLLIASILALLATEVIAIGYMIVTARAGRSVPVGQAVLDDPTLTLVRIVASGLAHVITFALAWWIVTDAGRRPFFESIGWGWRPRFGIRTVLVAFAGVYLASIVMAIVFNKLHMTPDSTPFDQILRMSFATRVAVGIFAVVSAPFVEEVVYRGVFYPALARRVGRVAAIVVVSAVFLAVHVDQYAGAVAYLLPLALLSVTLTSLRAYSRSLLPSFALHLLFNSVQVAIILVTRGQ